jgi:hypothetical protein
VPSRSLEGAYVDSNKRVETTSILLTAITPTTVLYKTYIRTFFSSTASLAFIYESAGEAEQKYEEEQHPLRITLRKQRSAAQRYSRVEEQAALVNTNFSREGIRRKKENKTRQNAAQIQPTPPIHLDPSISTKE